MSLPDRAYCNNCKKVVAYTAKRTDRDGKPVVYVTCPDCSWIIATFQENEFSPVGPLRTARRKIMRSSRRR